MICKTVTIKDGNDTAVINECDYDPEIHELFVEDTKEDSPKETEGKKPASGGKEPAAKRKKGGKKAE